jgi:aspartyl-tRNA(Asn)/glutamyl-tRNA(Gln) amidotransferase subunit B
MPEYEVVIGLEIHAELDTDTKIFCSCPTDFGAEPNTQVCPVCLGMPGTLPVLNEQALDYAQRVALALDCTLARQTKFDRKNYHYPDLPKGYQISQYDRPVATGGQLELSLANGNERTIRIRRVHLEEDAGKSIHRGDSTLVDFNRSGVPLVEIVTEPDLRSPEEARSFLQELCNLIRYTGVSDVKMQEGSLRCDANVSIHPAGTDQWGELTEVKNMNSFRAVKQALEYEIERQKRVLAEGKRVQRETRHWDEQGSRTISSRSKEEASDYRYFPEPDLVQFELLPGTEERVAAELPELPQERKQRFMEDLGLPEYDAGVLTDSQELGDFFDRTVKLGADPKAASNWLMSEVLGYLNAEDCTLEELSVTPEGIAELLELIDEETISGKLAKEVFELMCESGELPGKLVEERGLKQVTDEAAVLEYVEAVIEEHPDVVETIRDGKERAIGFLVGQVMQRSRGKANPQLVNELLREKIYDN